MKRILHRLLLAMFGLLTPPAQADETQDHCAARPIIVDLAERIIEGRKGLNRIKNRRFAADAAYLLIQYGDLNETEIAKLLNRMTKEKVRRGHELKSTYEIATGLGGLEEIDGDRLFNGLLQSQWRALILSDDGELFFELADKGEVSFPSITFQKEDWIAYFAAHHISDVPDARRAKVAETALRRGKIVTALVLLSDQEDLTAFYELAAEHPDHRVLREVPRFPETFGVSLREQSSPIDLGPSEGLMRDEFRWRFFELDRVDYLFGHFGFIEQFLNVTGREFLISDVAKGVNQAIDDGWLDPVRRPEQAWISLYRQLIERLGQEAVDEALGRLRRDQAFDTRKRPVRDIIHDAIALSALSPFASGEQDSPPEQPALLKSAPDFDWSNWMRVARMVREGRAMELTAEAEASIAIQLLFSAGQFDRAVALVENALPQFQKLHAYRGMMTRLDLNCRAFTWVRGTGFDPGNYPIYRFPAAL